MTTFLRLLSDKDKGAGLAATCRAVRSGDTEPRVFEVEPTSFDAVPGKPFAYWVSEEVRQTFKRLPAFEGDGRTAKQGLATADDFRFLRCWWETASSGWFPFAKGGAYSPFYADIYLLVNWADGGAEIANNLNEKGNVRSNIWMLKETANRFFFRPGLTWPLRSRCFAPQVLPHACIFSVRGYSAFLPYQTELSALALFNSIAFDYIFKVVLGRFNYPEFIVGALQKLPWPELTADRSNSLFRSAHRAWSLKRTLDTITETSHTFYLPEVLRDRLGNYDPPAIAAELERIQAEIDDIAFDLYGFNEADREAAMGPAGDSEGDAADDDEAEAPVPSTDALLSWAVGVAFGRFDWRLAIGERETPEEPDPFDPLPAKSPGMLPDEAEPFHPHPGILVDDPTHPHDLTHVIDEVLRRVDCDAPDNVRRWLQKDFFGFHLKQYSKSRRKAPIYWPLSTSSGSYTLWVYYPDLSSETLYSAINDFVEPKIKQVEAELSAHRLKGDARSREDDKRLEEAMDLEQELQDLHATLLEIAPGYKPNHDDGVQITAGPLAALFRQTVWQTVLTQTWSKLEAGDYDWAHLAMAYWSDRVRDKCKTDKSLAIAHDLENLYQEVA
jgi:hypothetical protein